jgi:hypothetical protein
MKYSLRSLMIAVTLAPPALALLWWLRDAWLVQVLTILVLMLLLLAALCMGGCLIFALISASHRLVRLLLPAPQAPAPNPSKP